MIEKNDEAVFLAIIFDGCICANKFILKIMLGISFIEGDCEIKQTDLEWVKPNRKIIL